MRITSFFGAVAAIAFAAPASGAGDAMRGAKSFQQCAACHSVTPGEHLTGPSLARVWGRKAGTQKAFLRYSEALKKSGVTWDEKTLDQWLTNPERFLPGNSMTFTGIKDANARQDLMAYLRTISEGKPPAMAEPKGSGMMMSRSQRAELRKADRDSQVTSVGHCRDTYTVRTASGATRKIWEFNLRLKTDSSDHGPLPGKPVIVGSGMMGDRASLVFATPAEISGFIRETCE